MTLREMFDKTLLDSSQFLLDESVELNIDKFLILVKTCLATYNKYAPYDQKFQIEASNLTYKFTEASHELGAPSWLSDVVPVRLAGVHPWYFRQKEEWVNKELEYKKQFPWTYRSPVLYLPVQATYEIHGVWHHVVTQIPGSKVEEKQFEVKTITYEDDDFFDFLTGRFMQIVGRSRRAFTLNDLPISVDASELVSDGKEKETSAIEQLVNSSNKWYLAWR